MKVTTEVPGWGKDFLGAPAVGRKGQEQSRVGDERAGPSGRAHGARGQTDGIWATEEKTESFPKMVNPRRDRREIRGMLNLKCLAVARNGLKKS